MNQPAPTAVPHLTMQTPNVVGTCRRTKRRTRAGCRGVNRRSPVICPMKLQDMMVKSCLPSRFFRDLFGRLGKAKGTMYLFCDHRSEAGTELTF